MAKAKEEIVWDGNAAVDPSIFFKVGWTALADANERHSVKYHADNNYRGKALGADYHVATRWSGWFPKDQVDLIEGLWSTLIPLNVRIDPEYNGWTECRYMTFAEGEKLKERLDNMFPKSIHQFQQGYLKVYFTRFIKKASEKQLTKAAK